VYLDDLAALIRGHIPEERMPAGDAHELLRLYAVLLRAKGGNVTQSDIHDAWSAWMAGRNDNHSALVAYEDLTKDVREEDQVFAMAVRRAADDLGRSEGSRPVFAEVLFPSGPPKGENETRQALDLYKIMVESSEDLVRRRQGVNTFFLTINGALLTASGLIVQSSGGNRLAGLGIAVLAVAGGILCAAWRSLITSFGQLNRGKFQVINTIERYLKAAIYAAEWEALGRGEDPKIYRSFTSREIWVPNALLSLYIVAAFVALLVATGYLTLTAGAPR
jgi:hypothetical protein